MSATSSRPSRDSITRLLRPRSIAIVGASSTPGALGAAVLANLERMQFDGAIHLINPKRSEINGRPCIASVDQLPAGVDVAVLAIPRAAVLDTIKALAARQVGSAVIFSAGFAEGGEAGVHEQHQLAQIAADSGMVIEGPNCLGLVNHVNGVALTFVETPPRPLVKPQGIGILSQSGAMAAVIGVTLASRALDVSYSVSTGNEAASGVEDYLDFLLDDPHTSVIGMIVEQFRQPRRFLELARVAHERGKRIVLLHPGRSEAARASAATHTGALAGDYAVMRTLVQRTGVCMVEGIEEFGDVLELALRCDDSSAFGATAIVGESGAFKALTLDLAEQIGLSLPALNDSNAPALRAVMPSFVPVSNPLDLTAQTLVDPDLYRRVLATLLSDERVGSVVLAIIQTDATTCDQKFPTILHALRELTTRKAIVFAGVDEGAAVPPHYIDELRRLGIPYFPSPERALRALVRLSTQPTSLRTERRTTSFAPLDLPFGVVPEYRSKQLLANLGIQFPEGRFVRTLEEALQAAEAIGFPVALKAQSAELSHKSDGGGVVLRLHDTQALTQGWQQLHAAVSRHRPGLVLDGVLIERMARPGTELILGARNVPEWGPVVLAGFGGVQAEVLKDVRLLAPDLTTPEIIQELQQLKNALLLNGFRGAPLLDVEAVAHLIELLGSLLVAEPAIREIDLNPVVVYPRGEGIKVLDALIYVGTGSD